MVLLITRSINPDPKINITQNYFQKILWFCYIVANLDSNPGVLKFHIWFVIVPNMKVHILMINIHSSVVHHSPSDEYTLTSQYFVHHFYPRSIGYCHALCHLSVHPSICPSILPAPVTTLQTTIFNGSCSYLVWLLTFVGAWNLHSWCNHMA